MGAIQPHFQWIQATPSTEVKRLEREADHSQNLMPKLRISETRPTIYASDSGLY